MEEGGGADLSVVKPVIFPKLRNKWGVGNSSNWGGDGGVMEDRGSNREGVKGRHSWGSKGEGGDSRGSEGEGSGNGLADGVNEPVLVQILRETVEGQRLETTGGSDSISEGGGQRSGKLGISF